MSSLIAVRVWLIGREKCIEFKAKDVTTEVMITDWNRAVDRQEEVFIFTDYTGSKVSITIKRVDMLAALPWNTA